MCVDDGGNMLTNKLMHVEDGDNWQRICVEELACGDSSVVWSGDGSINDELHIDEPRPPVLNVDNYDNWTIKSFTHWMWEIMGIIFIVFGMYYIKKYMNNNKNDQVLLKKKLINYEEHNDEEVIPIKEDIA